MPIADPWFYQAAAPAILITCISKVGFVGELEIVAVLPLTLTIAPAQAVAIMAPIVVLINWFGVHTYWRQVDRGAMAVMLLIPDRACPRALRAALLASAARTPRIAWTAAIMPCAW